MLHNGRLLILGGDDGNEDSDFIYDVQLQFPFNIKMLARLPSTRPMRGCGFILVDNKIFIFGGRNSDVSAKVTMYDITKNEFKDLEPLPYGVCDMATAKYGDNIVLAGGSDPNGYLEHKNTVISYNIKTQKSTELPPMKNKRSECRAVVDGNSLVVMGGKKRMKRKDYCQSSVEVFDFKTSTWIDFPSMNRARSAFIAEIV